MQMKACRALTAATLTVIMILSTVFGAYAEETEKTQENEIIISAADYIAGDMNAETAEHYNGQSDAVLLTGDSGSVSWRFTAERAGKYCLEVSYFPIISKNAVIEAGIKLDGEYPFEKAENITLKKLYKNRSADRSFDNRGNELLPEKEQAVKLMTDYVRNYTEGYNEPYEFELSAGEHTLTLVGIKDKIALLRLCFREIKEIPEYADYLKTAGNGSADKNYKAYLQAEDAEYTTSSMIVPQNDRTSPLTVPSDPYNILYNTIGGSNWSSAGEYAVWRIDVPKTGYYNIGIKFRQNGSKTILPVRKIYIDDKVLFRDMRAVTFPYSRNWQYMKLSSNGETAKIYLTEGEHTLKIESVLGEFSEYFERTESAVYELNDCYRSIIMITGASPDSYRDYQLDVKIPDVIEKLGEIRQELTDIMSALDKRKIGNSELTEMSTLCDQIAGFLKDTDTIPERLESFKTNIGALGNWCVTARKQSVEYDYFVLCGESVGDERVKANIFEKAALEIKSLISSFVNDYNSIGSSYDYEDSITVWISSGRDQANVLKTLIDSDFRYKNTVNVDLKLVTTASLLSALIAGKGPDAALGLTNSNPVDYAIRNAVTDLSGFEGYDELIQEFYPSAVEPFSFNGGVYALPETQIFPMLFYRKDVLNRLNLGIPKTWEEVANSLTELTNVNMEFGISCADSANTLTSMGMFLYQNGGKFYIDGNRKSGLTTEIALNSFKKLTDLYNGYRLPYSFDALNRFRSGEMPLVISNYSLYNQLCVSAPEIAGLWGVTVVPGTEKADGTVDHSVMATATGAVITQSSKSKQTAWEFLKWWASAETQASFGLKIEGLLGQAARYPTANTKAVDSLPWSDMEIAQLKEQWQYVKATPETPGSYFTPRHLYNAFRRVITYGDDPRQALIDYTQYIDREITSKRNEFGLS